MQRRPGDREARMLQVQALAKGRLGPPEAGERQGRVLSDIGGIMVLLTP